MTPAALPANRPSGACLEIAVGEMRQLFNAMDPAPFRERDLDPAAEEYIVDWAREQPASAPLRLAVRLTRETPGPETARVLEDAIDGYFRQRARTTRVELRELFRVGRISLVIGLAFLAFAIGVGEFAASFAAGDNYQSIIKESFVIGGWVALWRPIEIFLYDWWPILRQARLFDRLAVLTVAVEGTPPAPAAA
ncbi:MAG: hypothetical protein U1F10_08210 [Burkholderiales bacterium]